MNYENILIPKEDKFTLWGKRVGAVLTIILLYVLLITAVKVNKACDAIVSIKDEVKKFNPIDLMSKEFIACTRN